MLNIFNHQRNAKQKHDEISPHNYQYGDLQNEQVTNVGENVEKRESLCTVSGSVFWFSQYRKQYGHLLKK